MPTINSKLTSIDPFDPAVVESPWEFFQLLREQAPVYQLPNKAYYLVSRFDDVMQVVMDPEVYSSNLVSVLYNRDGSNEEPELMNLAGGVGAKAQATDVLAIADPPTHTRQRRVANRVFTMRRVAKMEQDIGELCHQLIDDFGAGNSIEVDWVKHFSVTLPMTIIVRLIGFPEQDIARLKKWSDASVALLSGVSSEQQLAEYGVLIGELFTYLTAQYDQAFSAPADNLLGDLIREAKQDAEEFGRDEVVSMLVQLLTAGNETTASLISSAMLLLLRDDDLQLELRKSPDKIERFIEEVLRLESPFHGHFRVVTKDTTLAGEQLKQGDRLMLLWSSADRDESQFKDADQLKLSRSKPRSHLAFGYGIHHCIGAALARAEARIAFETILQRFESIKLSAENDFKHAPSLFIRSLVRLNIQCERI